MVFIYAHEINPNWAIEKIWLLVRLHLVLQVYSRCQFQHQANRNAQRLSSEQGRSKRRPSKTGKRHGSSPGRAWSSYRATAEKRCVLIFCNTFSSRKKCERKMKDLNFNTVKLKSDPNSKKYFYVREIFFRYTLVRKI